MPIPRRLFDKGLQQIYGLGQPAGVTPSVLFESLQEVNGTIATTASVANVTISSVVEANTVFNMQQGIGGSNGNSQNVRVELTSPTNLRFTRGGSPTATNPNFRVHLLEYKAGIITSNQAVSVTKINSPDIDDTDTITAVDLDKAQIFSQGGTTTDGTDSTELEFETRWSFDSTTVVRGRLPADTGGNDTKSSFAQVVEFV